MKCAVSDFDRTLYVNETISRENLEAVRAWQKSGNWFVLATGRNEASVRLKLDEYGLKPDGLILNNGAIIQDREGTELYYKPIKDSVVREVLLYLHSVSDDGSGVSTRYDKVNVLSAAHTTTQKIGDKDLAIEEIEGLKEVVQIHRRRPDDEEGIRHLCEDLNKRFSEISAFANVCNADIVAKGVDKSAAVEWLEQYAGPFDQILVIGDSLNDVGMIRRFGGAAPGHASQAAREAASLIVNDVAEYLYGAM